MLTVALLIIISCNSDDPAEQIAFKPGEYRGTYSLIRDYGQVNSGDLEVDTMKFIFTVGTPNTLAMRLDPHDTQYRDFCDWNCTWVLDRDSLKVDNCKVFNSICIQEEHPRVTYYYYVENTRREIVFVKWERYGDDMNREIRLWVP